MNHARRWNSWIAWALVAAPTSYVLAAGIAKLADLPWFMAAVARWHLLPRWSIIPIAVIVPLLEVGLGLCWWLGYGRAWAVRGLVALLACFSLVYGLHLIGGSTPPCGCLGSAAAFERMIGEGPGVLARNGVVILALCVGAWMSTRIDRGKRTVSDQQGRPFVAGTTWNDRALPRSTPGFTLIEIIVVIAIVSLVVAISLPALERARGESKRTLSLSYLRSHAQIFAAYNGDSHDAMPSFLDPDRPKSSVRNKAREFEVETYYFMTHCTWNIALAENYYGGDHLSRSFTPPETPPDPGGALPVLTGYFYSCAFAADPAYWEPRTRTGPAQWRGTFGREVSFPSGKALLYSTETDWNNGSDRSRARVAFADGAAQLVPQSRLGPQYQGGDGGWSGSVHGIGPPPFMHTIDGTRGRDIR